MRRGMRETVARVTTMQANPPATFDLPVEQMQRMRAFETLAGQRTLAGNGTALLRDGPMAFAAIFAAIEAARAYVLVQFYTIRDDDLGRELAVRLSDRARAGVRVHVIYDGIGSVGLPAAFVDDLRAAGVRVTNFHAKKRSRNRFQVNFRNHRKIVVVDGQTGFVGGLNVGDEYMGRSPRLGHWRDTHLRIDGPAVAQLQYAFAEDWLWATGEPLDLHWLPLPRPDGRDVLILPTGPADTLETGSLYFCNAIGAARERVWIASPYFVPDVDIVNALKLAALRGVDVRLLVPERRDHWLVWLAAFSYFDDVRAAGVKVFRYADGFMHSKVVLVDDWFASVGTINLDNRSCRLNFEVTAIVVDGGFAQEVAAMLTADQAQSVAYETPLAAHPRRYIRYAAPFARLFAPIL